MEMSGQGFRVHTIKEAQSLSADIPPRRVGRKWTFYDQSLGKTRMNIQLDDEALWYLSIFFVNKTGNLEKYSLDHEGDISETHDEFQDELSVRKAIGAESLNDQYLDELMARYIRQTGSPMRLKEVIEPYITARFHF